MVDCDGASYGKSFPKFPYLNLNELDEWFNLPVFLGWFIQSSLMLKGFFPCVWKFNCPTEITQMAVCFLQIGAPGRSFLRTASALQIHTLLPVDLLTEHTSLKRKNWETQIWLEGMHWIDSSSKNSIKRPLGSFEVDSLKDLSRYCASLWPWNLFRTSSGFKSISLPFCSSLA